jgi:protein-disulfide isomerase
MWNYIELFYHEQGRENSGYVTESYLQQLAQQVGGLNLIAWTAARNDSALTGRLTSDARLASQTGLGSTPSFRIGQAPNTPYVSAIRKLLRG